MIAQFIANLFAALAPLAWVVWGLVGAGLFGRRPTAPARPPASPAGSGPLAA